MQARSAGELRRRLKTEANIGGESDDIASLSFATKESVHVQAKSLAVLDIVVAVSLVFGGCCVNVWSFESLLRKSSSLGSLITFGQMLFITCHSLPYFLARNKSSILPRLLPRRVPLHVWSLQVLVLFSGTLLNNWSFAFTPLTLQIVFRSSGLPVSMLLGRIFLKKRYSALQILSVLLVTIGVILSTVSRPTSGRTGSTDDTNRYAIGIGMLSLSLFLTGILGVLQEQTYKEYGPCWREGVFYTHLLSLPMFTFLTRDIGEGLLVLKDAQDNVSNVYMVFAVNLITQLICVSGVNQLASRVSSVSTNLVLTARKALSLCLSVWFFGSEWNYELVAGALLVFLGTICYAAVTQTR